MQPARRTPGLVMLALLAGSAASCAPLGLATLPIGDPIGDDAFRRASKEFSCPTDKINLVSRDDVASGLFDLEACGQRARYKCQQQDCIREPDPARWDPDPVICRNPEASKGKAIKCVKPYSPYD